MLLKLSQQNVHGNRLFSVILVFAEPRFDLETRPVLRLAGDPTETSETLVALPIDPARLPNRLLPRLPAEERLRNVVFERASAIADKEAGSASGGESCHRCMGSCACVLSRCRFVWGIEIGWLGLRKYVLRFRGRACGCVSSGGRPAKLFVNEGPVNAGVLTLSSAVASGEMSRLVSVCIEGGFCHC